MKERRALVEVARAARDMPHRNRTTRLIDALARLDGNQ
jgi:hypothetical protein